MSYSKNPIYRTMAWKRARQRVLDRDSHQCRIGLSGCRGRATSADHIIELAEGGSPYDDSNLQAACVPCNSAKSNRRRGRALREIRAW
jgi:5-methylcytosine-specific restriction endonuclease McrA